jgi:hypothetical protein
MVNMREHLELLHSPSEHCHEIHQQLNFRHQQLEVFVETVLNRGFLKPQLSQMI